ncbi:MAG: Gfo/Idh/MocA family oxidoreductase [Pseudomonadota bacterium]
MNETAIRCGIAGYGYMGEIRKRVIDSLDDTLLIGVFEPDPAVASKLEPSLRVDSLQALFDRGMDALFVCTPNAFAPPMAATALSRGVNVFCEKPPGRTVADIRAVIDAETAAAGPKLMFGFNHRFHPAVLKAKSIVEGGRLGGLLSLRGVYGKSGGINFTKSWRHDANLSGGGILLDQGIHMLDLFRLFAGDFEQVKAFADRVYWNVGLEDNAFVILKNKNKVGAMLYSSATLWKHTFRMDVTLENGYMIVEGLLSKSGSYGRESLVIGRRQFEDEADAVGNPSEEITYFDRDASWSLEVSEFIDAIRNDRPVRTSSSHDALRVMEIIEQAYADAGLSFGSVGDV